MNIQIEQKYDDVAIKYRNMRMYFYKHAIDIIHECQQTHVKLLGFDAFRITAKGIQPSLEFSKDYSALDLESSWSSGIHDLEKLSSSDFVFELVY